MTPASLKMTAVIAVGAVMAACGGDRAERGATAERGDASEVIDNASARWRPGEEWMLDDRPSLAIGSEARPEYQFTRITGAARLSDGRIVVADGGASELRMFSPTGEFVRRVGRRGEGPSEFVFIARMVPLPGDSLLVYDGGLARLSVFAPGGELARTVPVPAAGPGSQFAGVMDDGRFVFGVPYAVAPQDGLTRDSVQFVVMSADGQPADTLEVAAGGLYFQRAIGNRFVRMNPPFGPAAVASARGDAVYIASTDAYALRQHRPRESSVRTLRRPVEARAFTEDDFEQLLAPFPPDQQAVIREIPRPDRHPVIKAMLVDRTGHLWVQEYAVPGSPENRWAVFTADGILLGSLALPPRFRVMDIGPDYVLGVSVDEETGTESIHLHPLRRAGRS